MTTIEKIKVLAKCLKKMSEESTPEEEMTYKSGYKKGVAEAYALCANWIDEIVIESRENHARSANDRTER